MPPWWVWKVYPTLYMPTYHTLGIPHLHATRTVLHIPLLTVYGEEGGELWAQNGRNLWVRASFSPPEG